MSIEQKIADLLEEANKLEVEQVAEDSIDEAKEFQADGVLRHAIKQHGFKLVSSSKTSQKYEHPEHGHTILVSQAQSGEAVLSSKNGQTMARATHATLGAALKKHTSIPVHESIEDIDEGSHQADTTMKHVKNPTAGEKKAAKDMKPGIAGYKDRIDMLKSAEAGGRLKKEEAEYTVDMSEDIAALTNGEELSEEFKTKAATIFEAAVVTRVKSEIARLAEEFDAQLDEQVESIKEGLVEKVDGYLNYVVEQWMTDNELALESGMKNEILESFVSSMKGVFEQHYIEVPEEKFDVLGEMQLKTEAVAAKLDEQLAANVALSKQLNEMKRTASIDEFAVGMADTEAEKFKSLAEELAYDDAETFKAKLQTIKENYFGKKQTAPTVRSVVTDAPVALTEEVVHTPQMAHYLRTLSNMK